MDVEVYLSASEEETIQLGAEYSARLVSGDVVAFHGELGAGKTEFIKGICEGMHVHEIVTSPTYTIINHYAAEDSLGREVEVYHLDLYRVESKSELSELGLEEVISDPTAIKLIEWAENAPELMPRGRYDVFITNLDDENGRKIEIIHRDVVAVAANDSLNGTSLNSNGHHIKK